MEAEQAKARPGYALSAQGPDTMAHNETNRQVINFSRTKRGLDQAGHFPVREGETAHDILAFLTTEPNKLVGVYRPKATPVILTTPEEIDM
jgi:hypothetical protein